VTSFLERHVLGGGVESLAGVVDEDVDPALLFHDRLNGALEVCLDGDVHSCRTRPPAEPITAMLSTRRALP
jgi:hypothetical protein